MKAKHNSEELDFSKLETFQSIDPDADWLKLTQRISFQRNRSLKKRYRTMAWRIAASLTIILAIGYLSQQYLFSTGEMISVLTGDTPELVLLPDGSRVTLNSASEIRYPHKFKGAERKVILEGEAFFEVEKIPDHPFQVSIDNQAMVEVLGTSFNILSKAGNRSISILVIEGRVAFKDASNERAGVILERDQQATLANGIIKRDDEANLNMLSWKTGILYFDQSFIGEVVDQLEIHYKREILLDEKIPPDLKFTSTIDNQDLESVLEELSLVLDLEISDEENTIIISKPL